MTLRGASSIAAGGICMLWPALVNHYPLVFSDTGAFLYQLLAPFMIWDKPWVYGPVLVVVSLRLTLWLPALAQGLLVSAVLWRVQAVFGAPSPARHFCLCLLLAFGTTASWFTSLLMPDILASVTVLALFVLAFDPDRSWRWPMLALAIFAITAHLSHLVIAAACLVALLALRPRAVAAAAAPLAVAFALLLTTNLIGHGRPGISPYGAVFGLARLVADGPARLYLEENCPAAGFRMCDWTGRLPSDAEVFLWDPDGPVWTFPGGPIALAPEASAIVLATILSRPAEVATSALRNWSAQLVTLRMGNVLGENALETTVEKQLRTYYPAAEVARFMAGAQRTDRLRAIAAPWQILHLTLLVLGFIACVWILPYCKTNDRVMFALIVLIAVGLMSNGLATGALSGPYDRYEARIAWLLLLPPAMLVLRAPIFVGPRGLRKRR